MPLFIDLFNLIIDKKAVSQKYTGGIEQFRKDYNFPVSNVHQEDDELFSLGQMNNQFHIEGLIENGLSFDHVNKRSDNFTILPRYGQIYWKVAWLKHNQVFAWHICANSSTLEKVEEISSMSLDKINALISQGNNPFLTIRN
jgi:hypothetical protein